MLHGGVYAAQSSEFLEHVVVDEPIDENDGDDDEVTGDPAEHQPVPDRLLREVAPADEGDVADSNVGEGSHDQWDDE